MKGLAGQCDIDVVSLSGFAADEARNLEDLGVRVLLGKGTLHENRSVARQAHQTIDRVKRYGAFALSLATASIKRGYPPLWRSNVVAFERLPSGSLDFEDYDLVNIEHTYLLPVAKQLRAFAPDVPMILAAHNVETTMTRRVARLDGHRIERLRRRLTAVRVAQLERRLFGVPDHIVTVTQGDADWIRQVIGDGSRVSTIDNGVDLEYFTLKRGLGGANRAVFTGTLGHPPNSQGVLWLAHHVWPRVRQTTPDATVDIVGWSQFAPREVIDLSLPGVDLALDVPDVRPYLRGADVAVVPLHAGSGSRLKILEAMAIGTPVVSTSIGAEGLDPPDGAIRIADSPSEFAKHVGVLMTDEHKRKSQAELARHWVERNHNWELLASKLAEIWNSAVQRGARHE